ncbi:MAG TPA: hypothetical protein VGM27_18080 [Acidobacteriaceae bacterium]|jgi:hypothetical protein
MSRRSSAENRKLFNDWTGQEKSWLDYLDSAVAELLVVGEDRRIYLRDNLIDKEWELYFKWERRSKDPAYCRMQEVIVERTKRRNEKWYRQILREQGPFIIPLIVLLVVARNDFNHTEWLILFVAYVATRCYMVAMDKMRDHEEAQIVRVWDLHQKVDRLGDLMNDILREQQRAKSQ